MIDIILCIFILINTLTSAALGYFVYLLMKKEYNSIRELIEKTNSEQVQPYVIEEKGGFGQQIIYESKLGNYDNY